MNNRLIFTGYEYLNLSSVAKIVPTVLLDIDSPSCTITLVNQDKDQYSTKIDYMTDDLVEVAKAAKPSRGRKARDNFHNRIRQALDSNSHIIDLSPELFRNDIYADLISEYEPILFMYKGEPITLPGYLLLRHRGSGAIHAIWNNLGIDEPLSDVFDEVRSEYDLPDIFDDNGNISSTVYVCKSFTELKNLLIKTWDSTHISFIDIWDIVDFVPKYEINSYKRVFKNKLLRNITLADFGL